MESKKFYLSKLFWLGAIEITIGSLGLIGPFLETGDFSPAGIVAVVAGVLTIALRFVTDQPISVS